MKVLACLMVALLLLAGCAQPPVSVPPVQQVTSVATAPSAAAPANPSADELPAATATADDLLPPATEPTQTPISETIDLAGSGNVARPTPAYFGAPPPTLPAGKIEAAPPAAPATAKGLQVLYLNQTLHIWHPDEARDEDLGWPKAAIECAWLAPDGHTFYFSDDEGVKQTDLATPQPPRLLLQHYTTDKNPARNRRFCVAGQSESGKLLLVQARDQRWYQWGVLDPANGTVRVVEAPFGPRNEPWYCPGGAVWGQEATLFVSGYSAGTCNQAPGLYTIEYGQPLVPASVLTGTLPALEGRPIQKAGAWQLTRSPDGSQVAFWFDQGWATEDGQFMSQALYVVNADGTNPRKLTQPVAGRNGPPAWSADGQALHYATAEAFDVLDPQPWQIHRVDVASGQDQVVGELPARFVVLAAPEQAGKLPIMTLTDELGYQLHVLDVASGQLANGPANVKVIGWLPAE